MNTDILNTEVNCNREIMRDIFTKEVERQKSAVTDVIDKAIRYGRFANKTEIFEDLKSTILAFLNQRDFPCDRSAEFSYWLKLTFNSRIPTNIFIDMLIALNDLELIEEISLRGISKNNALADKLEAIEEIFGEVDYCPADKTQG